jgi:glutaredoxin
MRRVLLAPLLLLPGALRAQQAPPDLEVFVRRGCPHCAAAKPWLDSLAAARPDLRIVVADVADDRIAYQRAMFLADSLRVTGLGVPAFYVNGRLLIGWESPAITGREIIALIEAARAARTPRPGPLLPQTAPRPVRPEEERPPPRSAPGGAAESAAAVVAAPPPPPPAPGVPDSIATRTFGTLSASRLGLPLFTLAVGLLDGFNPCAMWALIYILTLLVGMRSRAKMLAVGGMFVGVGGVMYFLFMAAWLEVFLLIGLARWVQVLLGALALFVGAVNVKDFVALGRGISLSIPEGAKRGVYAQAWRVLRAENLAGALVAVAVLSVLVNVVELLCTAGLPAVYTQILSAQGLGRAGYYSYLALYQVAYIADDSAMLAIAVVTLSRARLRERGARILKLVSGLVMAGLGLVLLLRPEWLR